MVDAGTAPKSYYPFSSKDPRGQFLGELGYKPAAADRQAHRQQVRRGDRQGARRPARRRPAVPADRRAGPQAARRGRAVQPARRREGQARDRPRLLHVGPARRGRRLQLGAEHPLRRRRDREEPRRRVGSARMRAVVYEAFRAPLRVEAVADPSPPPHGAVVRVEASGLCRSDWHGWMGHDPDIGAFPHVPGHELAGVVEAVGAEVRDWRAGRARDGPVRVRVRRLRAVRGRQRADLRPPAPARLHALGLVRRARRARLGRRQPRRAARRGRRRGGGRARLPLRDRLPRGRPGRPRAAGRVGRRPRLRRRRAVRGDDRRGAGRARGGARRGGRRARRRPARRARS